MLYGKIKKRNDVSAQIAACEGALVSDWDRCMGWLKDFGFVTAEKNADTKVRPTHPGRQPCLP